MPWVVEKRAATYHDSRGNDDIEIGYAWTILRDGERRPFCIEVERDAIYNDIVITAVLRNQLAEDDPPKRVVITTTGDLRVSR